MQCRVLWSSPIDCCHSHSLEKLQLEDLVTLKYLADNIQDENVSTVERFGRKFNLKGSYTPSSLDLVQFRFQLLFWARNRGVSGPQMSYLNRDQFNPSHVI